VGADAEVLIKYGWAGISETGREYEKKGAESSDLPPKRRI